MSTLASLRAGRAYTEPDANTDGASNRRAGHVWYGRSRARCRACCVLPTLCTFTRTLTHVQACTHARAAACAQRTLARIPTHTHTHTHAHTKMFLRPTSELGFAAPEIPQWKLPNGNFRSGGVVPRGYSEVLRQYPYCLVPRHRMPTCPSSSLSKHQSDVGSCHR